MIGVTGTSGRMIVGIDIIGIDRIRRLWGRHHWRLADDVFTVTELTDSGITPLTEALTEYQARRLASVFAAKEAVAKALGLPHKVAFSWTDIVIPALPNTSAFISERIRRRLLLPEYTTIVTRWHATKTHAISLCIGEVR